MCQIKLRACLSVLSANSVLYCIILYADNLFIVATISAKSRARAKNKRRLIKHIFLKILPQLNSLSKSQPFHLNKKLFVVRVEFKNSFFVCHGQHTAADMLILLSKIYTFFFVLGYWHQLRFVNSDKLIVTCYCHVDDNTLHLNQYHKETFTFYVV